MFASPFFTSGRASILPSIATQRRTAHRQLADAAHAVDHAHHRLLSRRRVSHSFGYRPGVCVQRRFVSVFRLLHFAAAHRRRDFARVPQRIASSHRRYESCGPGMNTWKACATCASSPLIFGIGLVAVGWATRRRRGADSFSLFGERRLSSRARRHRRRSGACAGIGLILGAIVAHRIGRKL